RRAGCGRGSRRNLLTRSMRRRGVAIPKVAESESTPRISLSLASSFASIGLLLGPTLVRGGAKHRSEFLSKRSTRRSHRPKYRIVWPEGDEDRGYPPCSTGVPKPGRIRRAICAIFPVNFRRGQRRGSAGSPFVEGVGVSCCWTRPVARSVLS